MKTSSKTISALPEFESLYNWYRSARRDLPFRRTRDPYAIWISEVMLQQTRVAAMLPRYAAFTGEFPDVGSLADASEDAVVEAWKGLGYYSRARNLRLAAQQIKALGDFPRELDALMKLPGIGSYTAAAVLSIAFGKEHAVIDGNVKRVFSRLFLLDTEEKRAGMDDLARRLIAGRDPGEHNQALMELGALVCLPDRPLCGSCPLSGRCASFQKGGPAFAATLPPKRRETKLESRIEFLADHSPEGLLFVRDPDSRFLKDQWMLPARISISGEILTEHWRGAAGKQLGSVRHTITRHSIEAVLLPASPRVRIPGETLTARFSLAQGRKRAASSLMQKILSILE